MGMDKNFIRFNNSDRLSIEIAIDLFKKDPTEFWNYAQECFHSDFNYYIGILFPIICNQEDSIPRKPYTRSNINNPRILTK